MNVRNLLERRNTIYGACALWILFFHLFRYTQLPQLPVLSNFLRLGNLGVDCFLFLSGVSLCKSAKKNNYVGKKWLVFFRKRAARILLPYLIVLIPHYCWAAVFEHSGSVLRRAALFFCDLSFVTFWVKGLQTVWYVFGIALCYLLFPLIYNYVRTKNLTGKILLVIAAVGFACAAAFLPYFQNLEIVWARLPIFIIGVCYGLRDDADRKTPLPIFILAGLVLLILGWVVSADLLPSQKPIHLCIRWLFYVPMTLALLLLVSKGEKKIRVLEWTGSLSLEIYLVHITMLHVLSYFGLVDRLGFWLYLLLPLYAIPVAWLVRLITELILKKRKT